MYLVARNSEEVKDTVQLRKSPYIVFGMSKATTIKSMFFCGSSQDILSVFSMVWDKAQIGCVTNTTRKRRKGKIMQFVKSPRTVKAVENPGNRCNASEPGLFIPKTTV